MVTLFILLTSVSVLCVIFCSNILAYCAVALSLALFCFCFRFFRIPKRLYGTDSTAVLSPADGTVVAIEEVEEPDFLKCKCLQVSIFMSVWNVHINWFPISGVVRSYRYHEGDYLVARHPKSSTQNERTSVVVERPDGARILIRQIAGAVARRIVCYAKPDVAVRQCSELGFIKFGSRVDLFLPLGTKICVELGQKVVGTISKIAEL